MTANFKRWDLLGRMGFDPNSPWKTNMEVLYGKTANSAYESEGSIHGVATGSEERERVR